MKRFRRPVRRGFTITEMLAALMLLTAFAIVSTRLFMTTFRLSFDSAQKYNDVAAIDSALGMLRNDTWAAKAIAAKDGASVELTRDGGRAISWSTQKRELVRREGADETRWQMPADAHFAAGDATLTFVTRDGEIVMPSQINLVAKLTR